MNSNENTRYEFGPSISDPSIPSTLLIVGRMRETAVEPVRPNMITAATPSEKLDFQSGLLIRQQRQKQRQKGKGIFGILAAGDGGGDDTDGSGSSSRYLQQQTAGQDQASTLAR